MSRFTAEIAKGSALSVGHYVPGQDQAQPPKVLSKLEGTNDFFECLKKEVCDHRRNLINHFPYPLFFSHIEHDTLRIIPGLGIMKCLNL